ncbi:hypothetical protein DRJ17_00030 [Candidatus Woesearchaeota archaeon]|nr:MAG: hypothetical protein DRJ17_00030 [Candidatus Woesearchaeota archaeon]
METFKYKNEFLNYIIKEEVNIMQRKAQGLSLETIIIAVLVIIVLIALVAIFTGQIRVTKNETEAAQTQVNSCFRAGGICVDPDVKCSEDEYVATRLGVGADEVVQELPKNRIPTTGLIDCERPKHCCVKAKKPGQP